MSITLGELFDKFEALDYESRSWRLRREGISYIYGATEKEFDLFKAGYLAAGGVIC